MRGFTGLLMLATGFGIGAYAYYPDAIEQHVHLARVTRILTPVPTTAVDGESGQRNFSPGGSLFQSGSRDGANTAAAGEEPAGVAVAGRQLVRPVASSWQTVVTPAIGVPTGERLKSARPADDGARYTLVRDLQRELRRAGCYGGEIHGSWTQATRRALGEFMRRVNAALPAEEPDYVQLALVGGHQGIVCGVECAQGAVASAGGRCVPAQEVAQTDGAHPVVAPVPMLRSTGRQAILPGAGAPGDGWSVGTTVVATDAPVPRPRPADPLPGRMAIGAAVDEAGAPGSPRDGTARGNVYADPNAASRADLPIERDQRAARRDVREQQRVRRASAGSQSSRRRALFRQAFGDAFN
ncbi:MAG: hypothetical protein NW205_07525 [Hyphomicrobiaceae bacterium]|nr:hypothetical protein [Hyphomicrobiaceae bacterium]